jgi:methylmalonyl-CoA mutase
LRATTEAMSAVLGGADSIAVASLEEPYKHPDEASRRLARNTQIILKKEAYLGRVSDPGGGSYYIEALTDTLARFAWETMQHIEAAGGYSHQEAAGVIQEELDKSLVAAESAVAMRKRIFLGTNQYPNPAEKALDRIEADLAHEIRRGPEVYEEIRLRTERHCVAGGKCPRFLLAAIGDPKMRSARASFAANFFGCAGFDVVTQGFANVANIANSDADVIVLCSSDPEYPQLVTALLEKLGTSGRNPPVVVAGYPESAEQLKQLGVADFVHVRCNPVESLKQWQSRLGVKD